MTSTLHRIPAYLRSRPTVADAFRALEAIRDGEDALEAELAREALDLLAGVRRELRVYLGLQRVYEAVAAAPPDLEAAELRARSCRALIDLFAHTDYRIAGLDRLPTATGNIVLSNHLDSHPTNRLPNGFSLILDTHFVSSMILYRTYGKAPVRVVRDSHWHEAGHARYYARLGYVMVPSAEADPLPADERSARYARFLDRGVRGAALGARFGHLPGGSHRAHRRLTAAAAHRRVRAGGPARPGAADRAGGVGALRGTTQPDRARRRRRRAVPAVGRRRRSDRPRRRWRRLSPTT